MDFQGGEMRYVRWLNRTDEVTGAQKIDVNSFDLGMLALRNRKNGIQPSEIPDILKILAPKGS